MIASDEPTDIAELRRALRVLVNQLTEPEPEQRDDSVASQIRRHLGDREIRELPILAESLESWDLPNLQLAVDDVLGPAGPDHQQLGLPSDVRHYGGMSLTALLEHGFRVGPLEYTNVPVGPDQMLPCLENAVHLVRLEGVPIVVFSFIADDHGPGGGGLTVQVVSTDAQVTTAFLVQLREAIARHDVYRGQVITVQADRFGRSGVTFVERPTLSADDLVLPEGALDRITDHVVGPTLHRDRLVKHGQHLSRGLLLWGPPGTGKTHTVRYLTGCLTDATIILLSGASLGMVGGFAGLARRLAPAVVVLEDVDLVAHQRVMGPHGAGNSVLFELMDEMSGHGLDADIAFVLTTNMPEALESALAARPGRVDLAVEIPLPDATCRHKLFDVYTRDLKIRLEHVDELVERTEGVTASFVRELMRKATLRAARAGDETVTDEHVEAALDELLSLGSALTRTLLGVGGTNAGAAPDGGWAQQMPHSAMQFLESYPGAVDVEIEG